MDYTISSVEKALQLLSLIGDMPGRGLSELSRASGNSKARTYRLLQTMEAAGFVLRSDNEPRYWLGDRSRRLGEQARDQVDIVAAAVPIVERIAARCNETVQVRVRQGTNSCCVLAREPDRTIRHHAEEGRLSPIHVGTSKLLLAYASPRVQKMVLSGPLQAKTAKTIASPERLAEKLVEIRKQGYCISVGENDPDSFAVGAPVRDAAGSVIAVLIIAAPVSRINDEKSAEFTEMVLQGAHQVEGALSLAEFQER
ncbi:IclR family transcriptional regulator [Consotaella salsifontis]|uniref:IclR family transcriptional regulator n=1 Tax=Consotaella salsifontis TaxID=1365950 RepID=UPI0013F65B23